MGEAGPSPLRFLLGDFGKDLPNVSFIGLVSIEIRLQLLEKAFLHVVEILLKRARPDQSRELLGSIAIGEHPIGREHRKVPADIVDFKAVFFKQFLHSHPLTVAVSFAGVKRNVRLYSSIHYR